MLEAGDFALTVDLEPDDVALKKDVVVVIDAEDVANGNSKTYEFHQSCWGVGVGIEEDGTLRIDTIGIG